MRVIPYERYLDSLNPAAAARVRSSLTRTAEGFDVDLVTPLIPEGEPDYWREVLGDEIFRQATPTGYPRLDEAEEEQRIKLGAYSIMAPWEMRRPDVMKYFYQAEANVDIGAFRRTLQVIGDSMPSGLRALSLDQAYNEMPKGTNLGAPFFTSNDEFRPLTLELAKRYMSEKFRNGQVDPCLLYWRGQPRGIGQASKNRTVWGYPHWITILELSLQTPMLQRLRSNDWFAAWSGLNNVDRVVTNIFDDARQPLLSVDFSGFDASVPAMLIEGAFWLIRRMFDANALSQINFVEDRFMHIDLFTPEGIWSDRSAGVPSGSGLTNLVDSLIQIIIWYYYALTTGNRIRGLTVQGDDGVVSFDGPWSLDEIIDHIRETWGMRVSDDKGGVSTSSVNFLQNIHLINYRPDGLSRHVRPIERVLNGMMSYERLTRGWNGYMDTLRWWQQAENAEWHPKFNTLVNFLWEHDKYSRSLNVSTVLARAGGLDKVQRVLKEPSFPYGKKPIAGLATYRIVTELAQ